MRECARSCRQWGFPTRIQSPHSPSQRPDRTLCTLAAQAVARVGGRGPQPCPGARRYAGAPPDRSSRRPLPLGPGPRTRPPGGARPRRLARRQVERARLRGSIVPSTSKVASPLPLWPARTWTRSGGASLPQASPSVGIRATSIAYARSTSHTPAWTSQSTPRVVTVPRTGPWTAAQPEPPRLAVVCGSSHLHGGVGAVQLDQAPARFLDQGAVDEEPERRGTGGDAALPHRPAPDQERPVGRRVQVLLLGRAPGQGRLRRLPGLLGVGGRVGAPPRRQDDVARLDVAVRDPRGRACAPRGRRRPGSAPCARTGRARS
jgi:hypothetical protein